MSETIDPNWNMKRLEAEIERVADCDLYAIQESRVIEAEEP